MTDKEDETSLTLDKKTVDVLVAQVIPTSKYFEIRFDHMQDQMDRFSDDLKDFRGDVNKRFDVMKESVDRRFDDMTGDIDKRFEQVDKRFDAVKGDMDKRFEQVDKRFEQVIASIERLGDKLDYRDEKQRGFTLRMFTIAIGISILGALGHSSSPWESSEWKISPDGRVIDSEATIQRNRWPNSC